MARREEMVVVKGREAGSTALSAAIIDHT